MPPSCMFVVSITVIVRDTRLSSLRLNTVGDLVVSLLDLLAGMARVRVWLDINVHWAPKEVILLFRVICLEFSMLMPIDLNVLCRSAVPPTVTTMVVMLLLV